MSFVPWRRAWQDALYGPGGFFVSHRPGDHFRTSVTASPVFAEAVARLADDEGLTTIVDMGAGGGELLTNLQLIDAELRLIGIDLAPRPDNLPATIDWQNQLPTEFEGLLLANEWLDNIPCDVVEVDGEGVTRFVLVDPQTSLEQLGEAVDSAWLNAWWPISEPGQRAEIGEPRDQAWADAVGRVTGLAVAVDYGHQKADRPPFGSLASFATGQEIDVRPDGTRDVTAHVAIDAVAERVGGCLERQRDALTRLGVDGSRPPIQLATDDPGAYLQHLSRAGDAAELRARGGWGDFWWVVTDTRGDTRPGAPVPD
jgi:SAM-dependent MidA family methyltransferase